MQYETAGYCSYRNDDDGPVIMANFIAEIVEEIRIVDGLSSRTVLRIKGTRAGKKEEGQVEPKPVPLPMIDVDADAFAGLGWVLQKWGAACVIFPGASIKDDLRAMIQTTSDPKVSTVYKHTGWTEDNGKRRYIHAGGAIGEKGNDPKVSVMLPPELAKFDLCCVHSPKDCAQASLQLLDLANKDITWPLLAASLSPLYGPVDFGLHLAGRTGTYKSECISLFQSLYGQKLDARNLPGSWSSTANALEAQAFLAKNAAFVIDDFVPHGTSWQVRSYQQNADKIIRAQGNQAGRARLTDTSNLQPTMYPRGIILSTGEDVPEGHSVRARLMILELSPGDVSTKALTHSQKMREYLPGASQNLIQRLAGQWPNMAEQVRDRRDDYIGIGHSRTPAMMARLICTAEHYLDYCGSIGLVPASTVATWKKDAAGAITRAGNQQQRYLEDADPVDIFFNAMKLAFGRGGGHLRSMNGGIPSVAVQVGWTTEEGFGEVPTYKSRGPVMGWISPKDNAIYLDVATGYNIVRKEAGNDLNLTRQTMFKRLKDAGKLLRVEDNRERNTVRVTADGHGRTVLALPMSEITTEE